MTTVSVPRRARLVRFLDDHDLDALVLCRPRSVAWSMIRLARLVKPSGSVS